MAWARTAKAARIFARPQNWSTWYKVVRVLTTRETHAVVRAVPQIVLKHWRPYLGSELTHSERAAILIDHYSFLPARLEKDFFRKIVDGQLPLWEHVVDSRTCRILLKFSPACHDEGDLTLHFELDGMAVYALSCSIGPGEVAGVTAEHAIFIGRIQGRRDGLGLIREATRLCTDIAPAALLLAAVEGLALSLGIEHIIGIGGSDQLKAPNVSRQDGLTHTYDDFWTASGGRQLVRNMYHLSVPLAEKPILEVKRHHRSRTLRKRTFRRGVTKNVGLAFQEFLRPERVPADRDTIAGVSSRPVAVELRDG